MTVLEICGIWAEVENNLKLVLSHFLSEAAKVTWNLQIPLLFPGRRQKLDKLLFFLEINVAHLEIWLFFFFYHIAISTVPPAAFKLRLGNHYSSALRQSPISNYIPCCRCTGSIPAVFLLCASFFTRPFATPYSIWEAKLSTQPFYLSDNLDDQEPSQALFLKSV